MNKLINFSLMFCIGVYVTSTNYLVGNVLNLSGQQVSLILDLVCLVLITPYKSLLLNTRLFSLSAILVLIIPFISYVINYHAQDFSELFFWFKRAVSSVITIGAGVVLITRLKNQKMAVYAEFIFIIICSSVVYSWLYPNEAIYLFAMESQGLWDDLLQINVTAPAGTFINVNDTGVALVGSYLVWNTIMATSKAKPSLLHIMFLDLLLCLCVLIGGSRSTFIIGFFCIALTYFFRIPKRAVISLTGRIQQIIIVIFILNIVLVLFPDIFSSYGVVRISDFINSNESSYSLESKDLRWGALMYSINLFLNNLLGLSFDTDALKNVLLPHNTFVYYGVTNGIFALIYYIYVLYIIISSVHVKGLQWLSACYAIFLVGFSLFVHTLIDSKTFSWLIIGAIYFITKHPPYFTANRDNLQNNINYFTKIDSFSK